MAWQAVDRTNTGYYTNDGTSLQASTTITSSTASTGVFVGRGVFDIVIDVTAYRGESAFDNIIFWVQRNTAAATTTWQEMT